MPQSSTPSSVVPVTPSPNILKAITRNPLNPVDALCELIDNAIDSFSSAEDEGIDIGQAVIAIQLPSREDVKTESWTLSVRDNGPGLSREGALSAVTAGYSGNNPHDRLGLFGLGFNTATGKIGALTELRTRQHTAGDWTLVEVDLERMIRVGSYNVDITAYRADGDDHGTVVQITRAWPAGDPNADFIEKLTSSHASSLRRQIGRRYSTLIRKGGVRINLNGTAVEPFHHCVWGDDRYVWIQKQRIPAIYRFNDVVGSGNYCSSCHRQVFESACDDCAGAALVTREQRVHGWVGIQRFDDTNDFGVDFIRNGRAILVAEQDAIFTWETSDGDKIKDYPIDAPFGRIVGEVHIDHVPTDYLKQDFQRTSQEWQEVMSRVRGDSTLQPRRRLELGEPENDSPIYKLYQAYRRVRDPGRRSMYAGYWPKGASKPSRLDRATEKDLVQKFRNRVPEFIEDTEWWRFVEQAETPPVTANFKECPECAEQTFDDTESCLGCGHVFMGKTCPGCAKLILAADDACPHCEAPQPRPAEPWSCSFCSTKNAPDGEDCESCHRPRHAVNPLSPSYLEQESEREDALSHDDFAITLPGGGQSSPIAVTVRIMKPGVHLPQDGVMLPAVRFIDGAEIRIFIDQSHDIFVLYGDRPEDIISMELARWVVAANEAKRSPEYEHQWSLTFIYWRIQSKYWSDRLPIEPTAVKVRIDGFFSDVRERLSELLEGMSSDIYDELDEIKKAELMKRAVQEGENIAQIHTLVSSGRVFAFFPPPLMIELVSRYPARFFDGQYWDEAYESVELTGESKLEVQGVILRRYQLLLEDAINYTATAQPDPGYTARASQTVELLERHRSRD